MDKDQVAEILAEIGMLLELKGENPSRRAPTPIAARCWRSVGADREIGRGATAWRNQRDRRGAAGQDQELVQTGKLVYYEKLKASLRPVDRDAGHTGSGSKKVKKLNELLKVETVEALEAACQANQVAGLEGFGARARPGFLKASRFAGNTPPPFVERRAGGGRTPPGATAPASRRDSVQHAGSVRRFQGGHRRH